MPIDQVLVLSGVSVLSSAVGVLIGSWAERRRMVREVAEEAQTWLDHRTSR